MAGNNSGCSSQVSLSILSHFYPTFTTLNPSKRLKALTDAVNLSKYDGTSWNMLDKILAIVGDLKLKKMFDSDEKITDNFLIIRELPGTWSAEWFDSFS